MLLGSLCCAQDVLQKNLYTDINMDGQMSSLVIKLLL